MTQPALFELPDAPSAQAAPPAAADASRSATKPSSAWRRAPFFAAGWDGRPGTAIVCRDCGLDCFVGLAATDPARAEIAHIDPSDQRWFSVRGRWSNVTVCCRACNHAQGRCDLRELGLTGLLVSRAHVDASIAEAARRRADQDDQEQRRRTARAAARRLRAAETSPSAPAG